MAGRPRIQQADLNALAKLDKALVKGAIDLRPALAYVMKHCGCTYEEIGMVFGVTRQAAKLIMEQAENNLKGLREYEDE